VNRIDSSAPLKNKLQGAGIGAQQSNAQSILARLKTNKGE
jgi:hypothetical protein